VLAIEPARVDFAQMDEQVRAERTVLTEQVL
jgi:hypothetical protein